MSLFSRACFASTVFATVLSSATVAQPPERRRGGERGGPGGFEGRRGGPPPEVMMRMMPVLAALDADHDGKISKAEIDNATAALKSLDKNSDGQLTADEVRPDYAAMAGRGGPPRGFSGTPDGARPGGGGRPGGGIPREMIDRLMQSDKNKDGKLTKDEVVESMQGLFSRADADSDGVATREELEAIASRGSGRRPGGPEGRRGPGGPEFFSRMFDDRDANKDDKLTGDEIPEQMAGRLEQIDADKDGSVSRSEMETMMSRMRQRGGVGRGGADSGGRPGGDRPRRPEAE